VQGRPWGRRTYTQVEGANMAARVKYGLGLIGQASCGVVDNMDVFQ
jgi:hypothetical protein